jgi:ectoine hydroxylase-related dioxygenase (phytanoyl-CoA dioxygenase family)
MENNFSSSGGIFQKSEALSDHCVTHYQKQGWVLIRDFFSVHEDLLPIHAYVNKLIDIKLEELGLKAEETNAKLIRNYDFLRIAKAKREKAGDIYRACRHLLPLHKLSLKKEVIDMASKYMDAQHINYLPYTAMRIDIPGENKYLFPWHQDYPYTQGSIDGIVIWLPLFDVALGHGNLRLIPESHRYGVRKVYLVDPTNKNKNGARTISIVGEEELDKEPYISAEVKAGDALVFSTLLLRRSTPSESKAVRWTIQLRYANFCNQDAVARGWPGGMIEGDGFEKFHPEFVAQKG